VSIRSTEAAASSSHRPAFLTGCGLRGLPARESARRGPSWSSWRARYRSSAVVLVRGRTHLPPGRTLRLIRCRTSLATARERTRTYLDISSMQTSSSCPICCRRSRRASTRSGVRVFGGRHADGCQLPSPASGSMRRRSSVADRSQFVERVRETLIDQPSRPQSDPSESMTWFGARADRFRRSPLLTAP